MWNAEPRHSRKYGKGLGRAGVVTHFFLQLRKQAEEAQGGKAGCPGSHSPVGGGWGPSRGWLTCALITEPSGPQAPPRPMPFPISVARGPQSCVGPGNKWHSRGG